MIANRWLIIGESGSGKSYFASALIDDYLDNVACDLMVCFSTDAPGESRLAERCAHHVELTDELAELTVDHVAFLQKHKSVYYELTALNPHRFIGDVSEAVLALGYVLIVFDEADGYVNQKADRRTLSLYPRGRKRGVNIATIATSIKQNGALGLAPEVVRRSNILVAFHTDETHEQNAVYERFPRAKGQLGELLTPRDGGLPEYVIRAEGGRELLVSRTGERDLRAVSAG